MNNKSHLKKREETPRQCLIHIDKDDALMFFLIQIKLIFSQKLPDKSCTSDTTYIFDVICRIEHDCLELKAIIFNKELRKFASFGKLDENQRTVENANKIAAELTRFSCLSFMIKLLSINKC